MPSLKHCLSAFQVALELRAKELEWPECLELAKLTIEEIGEEGRKMVIDRDGLLDIGYDLVDRLLRDMETAAEKKAKDEEAEKVTREKEEKAARDTAKIIEEIARGSKVIVEQLAAYAKGYTENADANPEETLTSMDETPGDTETQKTPSNGTQQATPIDTSLEEVGEAFKEAVLEKKVVSEESACEEHTPIQENEWIFEEIVHEDAEAASKEAAPEKITPPQAKTKESFEEVAYEDAELAPEEVTSEKIAPLEAEMRESSEEAAPDKIASLETETAESLEKVVDEEAITTRLDSTEAQLTRTFPAGIYPMR